MAEYDCSSAKDDQLDNNMYVRYSVVTMMKLQAWHLKSETISAADVYQQSGMPCMVSLDGRIANFQPTATGRCAPP